MDVGHFIGVIHKDAASGYGISFPDVPGVIAVGDTLDEAVSEGAAALAFAFEDWSGRLPQPRSLEAFRNSPDFAEWVGDGVIVAVRPYAAVAAA